MDELKKIISTFARIKPKVFPAIALLIVSLLVTSCATAPSSRGKEVSTIAHKKIIIMPVILQYESISNEAKLAPADHYGEEAGAFLMGQSAEILSKEGFGVLDADALFDKNPKFKSAYNRMLDERMNLFRPLSSAGMANDIEKFGASSENANILVLLLRVKVGGTWNPITGKSAFSGVSGARLKAALVETKNGRRLWTNEVQLRELPKPDKRNYKKAIDLLFETLKTHEGE